MTVRKVLIRLHNKDLRRIAKDRSNEGRQH